MQAQDARSSHATRISKALVGKSKRPTAMLNKEWNDMDSRSLSTIWQANFCLTLLEMKQQQSYGAKWKVFIWKSLTNKIFLKRHLYNLRMKEGTKIVDHLNVFNTLFCQLSSME
jgi:hypothetical protein